MRKASIKAVLFALGVGFWGDLKAAEVLAAGVSAQESFGPPVATLAQQMLWQNLRQNHVMIAPIAAAPSAAHLFEHHDEIIPQTEALGASDRYFSGENKGFSGLAFAPLIAAEGSIIALNSGDRLVVTHSDGQSVYKDDDALLRRAGVRSQIFLYEDGSSRSVIQRADGGQVLGLRDGAGRILHRKAIDAQGVERVLINDLLPEADFDASLIEETGLAPQILVDQGSMALRAEPLLSHAQALPRRFSLRQIRHEPLLRAMAPLFAMDQITFNTSSAEISADQARNLADLAQLVEEAITQDPSAVFLIEGHSDPSGAEPYNLMLSDRRAESLALALVDYFALAPEHFVVQGYGSSEPLEGGDALQSRRVVMRLITPLLAREAADLPPRPINMLPLLPALGAEPL